MGSSHESGNDVSRLKLFQVKIQRLTGERGPSSWHHVIVLAAGEDEVRRALRPTKADEWHASGDRFCKIVGQPVPVSPPGELAAVAPKVLSLAECESLGARATRITETTTRLDWPSQPTCQLEMGATSEFGLVGRGLLWSLAPFGLVFWLFGPLPLLLLAVALIGWLGGWLPA